MDYERLFNFISPVTGKLPVQNQYILIGDKDNRSFASPVLIDIKQNIIDLRRKISSFEELKKLTYNRIWIGDQSNEPVEQLNIGIINLPPLVEAVFPNPLTPITGDFRIPNPTFDYLSAFDWVMSGPFLPQIFATKYDNLGNPTGTTASSSLAMAQVRLAQIMKRFDNANFIVGSSQVDFFWENPKMSLIPEELKTLYGLNTTYTFTKAQSLGSLETGILKNVVSEGHGTLSKAIPGEDFVDTTIVPIGPLAIFHPLVNPDLNINKLISPTDYNIKENLPNEFDYPVAGTITILTGIAGKFEKMAVTSIDENSIIKTADGQLKKANDGTDYISYQFLLNQINNLIKNTEAYQSLLVSTSNTLGSDVTYNEDQSLNTDVTMVNLSNQASDNRYLTAGVVAGAAVVIAGALLLPEVAGAAALASVVEAGSLFLKVFPPLLGARLLSESDPPILTEAQKNYAYGLLMKGNFFNTINTWKSADLNDYAYLSAPWIGQNGQLNFKYCLDTDTNIMDFNIKNRGMSNLWFDSWGRSTEEQQNFANSEAGLRLFAWNSGGDGIDYEGEGLAPLHIGLFGYDAPRNITGQSSYTGFMFSSEFFNLPGFVEDKKPKNFGLYLAAKNFNRQNIKSGFDFKEKIFEYDLEKINFEKPIQCNDHIGIRISIGNTNERPLNSIIGVLRYNTEI